MESTEVEKTVAVDRAQCVRSLLLDLDQDVDTAGIDLLRLLRLVANQFDVVVSERLRDAELSPPRFALLMRLLAEEKYGRGAAGISPTHLSRSQSVSKNTISALLRGLEEQGLIERELDPEDRRGFLIRASALGRSVVLGTAPRHLSYLNELLADLTPEEQEQLKTLLGKLHASLARRGVHPRIPPLQDGD